jgi:foldase protein PrsA
MLGMALICLLLASALGCDDGYRPPVVAKLNGQEIGLDEFVSQAAYMGLGVNPTALNRKLRQEVLESIVNRRLILDQAEQRGIKQDPAELDARVEETRTGLGRENMDRHLAALGLTYQTWRAILDQEVLVSRTMEIVLASKTRVTAKEIATYYQGNKSEFQRPQQVLAQHALLPTKELAEKLLAMIKQGADMAEATAELGAPMAEGGKAIWLSRGHMPDELENEIFRLKKDQLAGPLKSAYGYHVVHLLDQRPAVTLSLAQAAVEIQRRLSAKKKEDMASAWLAELRSQAEVWYDPAFLDKGTTEKVNR